MRAVGLLNSCTVSSRAENNVGANARGLLGLVFLDSGGGRADVESEDGQDASSKISEKDEHRLL